MIFERNAQKGVSSYRLEVSLGLSSLGHLLVSGPLVENNDIQTGFVRILKSLEFQESNFKALKVFETGFWSLKVLDFSLNWMHIKFTKFYSTECKHSC